MLIGDRLEEALTAVGVTKDVVERFLGRPCRCPERQEKLNQLGRWAERILKGRLDKAREYLQEILEQADEQDCAGRL